MATLYRYWPQPGKPSYRFGSLEGGKRWLNANQPGWDVAKLHACQHDIRRGVNYESTTPMPRLINTLNRMLKRMGHTEELWSHSYLWDFRKENPKGDANLVTVKDYMGRWALYAVEGASEGFYAHWDCLCWNPEASHTEVLTISIAKWFDTDHQGIYKFVADTAMLLRV